MRVRTTEAAALRHSVARTVAPVRDGSPPPIATDAGTVAQPLGSTVAEVLAAAEAATTAPPNPPGDSPPAEPAGPSERGKRQMEALVSAARAGSAGRNPAGWCYAAVWNYITQTGYGRMPATGIPDSHASYAKQFAWYASANLQALGLRKLPLDNPYEAPTGAIVVVNPGTPGTSHPTAGDIAIAAGNGRFLNDGEMSYGGSQNFPPGNRHVLGVFVPA
ncbi:MAG: hypothetical protein FJZ00_14935 [Candidatus Sericytochromatia bacterium]|uniref:CHAP domain-containing protein n=1 Tax=Candidatus Tanganyikabacteria bacterium TaxID=2961651 RepID=A0A937X6V0_9BACT|nr:hypothetical protein [Candidatus Tanganyikabacteria bacterium]